MKGIIIDDEAKSRSMLEALCREYCPELEIIGQAGSVDEGLDLIAKSPPDLVFLDIQMPVKNGFQLFDAFEEEPPFQVIFTTAYDEYGLQAFKITALDYLLKPIQIDELIQAVEKAQKIYHKEGSDQRIEMLKKVLDKEPLQKVALTTIDGFTFVNFSEIIRCEAQGNYTDVILAGGHSLLITKTLKHYEDILTEKGFFRVHKSHLVNLHFVRRYIKGKQGSIEMTDGQIIEVSLRKKEALLEQLSQR